MPLISSKTHSQNVMFDGRLPPVQLSLFIPQAINTFPIKFYIVTPV